jgi:thiamine biosynthesis lipoprotein ApbE
VPARCVSEWRALGTTVLLKVMDDAALGPAEVAVRRELDAIDLACSRFREDSEISRANERAGQTTAVSSLLAEAVDLALRAAALTDGDVDPTIGRSLVFAGYDRDWDEMDRAGERMEDRAGPARMTLRRAGGWGTVSLDRRSGLLRVPAGIELDLGATAKAWAADRAAGAASVAARCGVLVSLGGDIAVSGAGPDGGWYVHVTDDHRASAHADGQTIRLSTGGLATSSTTVRRWMLNDREMHHIIDPVSQAPADSHWRTVSVAAATCAEANIASTAAIVKTHAAVGWLTARRLPARLVDRDGRATQVCGWPHEERRAA